MKGKNWKMEAAVIVTLIRVVKSQQHYVGKYQLYVQINKLTSSWFGIWSVVAYDDASCELWNFIFLPPIKKKKNYAYYYPNCLWYIFLFYHELKESALFWSPFVNVTNLPFFFFLVWHFVNFCFMFISLLHGYSTWCW